MDNRHSNDTDQNSKKVQHKATLPHIDYHILFEELPEGVFTINTRWRITSFNRTAEKITGYCKEKVIGRHCWDVFHSNLCHKNCPLSNSLKTGKKLIGKEINIINNEGTQQALLVNSCVLRDHDGTVLGAVETFRPPNRETVLPLTTTEDYTFSGIIGKSRSMQSLFSVLPDIAASEASAIISGESGTGKGLLPRAIHHHSQHNQGPFVIVNCVEYAESLLESELFGHEKGAFTGAVQSKAGRFEVAKGGTIFLDEIGELKPEIQVKLLRVLEQKTFERVGGTQSIKLQARVISATNINLKQALKKGQFREDLYYRLRTVPLHLPPLRERLEDIPLLVTHFIKKFNVTYNKKVRSVDPKVIRLFSRYSWPGNIRELERCIEHAFVFVKGPVIFSRHLPDIKELNSAPANNALLHNDTINPNNKDSIIEALSHANGKRQEAAALLGISRTSLWRKMKALGLKTP